MKTMMWFALWIGIFGAAAVMGQDAPLPEGHPPVGPDLFRQMEMQNRHLDLQAREEKLRFEREMNNLQLEQRRFELERQKQAIGDRPGAPQVGRWRGHGCRGAGIVFMVCALVHILMTVWVYRDIRRRNAGSGTWIAVTLLTGLFGAAVYIFSRIGDKQGSPAC